MVLSFDRLQALRECCRDDAAFKQLRQILGIEDEPSDPNHDPKHDPNHLEATASPDRGTPATTRAVESSSSQSRLLQGVAEATTYLLTSTDYTTAINAAIATLGRATEADRVYIFAIHPHPTTGEPACSLRFEWVQDPVTPQLLNPIMQNRGYAQYGLTRWYNLLHQGQTLSGLTNDFPQAEADFLRLQDIRAVLIVPIAVDGHLWGCVGFDACQRERLWSRDEESVLQLVAAGLGGAIARQQAELELRQSRYHLAKIAANVPGMIYQVVRAEGQEQLLYASPGCLELTEIDPDTIKSDFSLLRGLIHPDDWATYEQSLEASVSTLQPWSWEGRLITPSGRLKWVQGVARPERQPNGHLLWDGIFVDITDRKQAEEECRQSEARYRAMLDASPDLMFRLRADGIYLDFKGNQQTTIPREALLGKHLTEVLPPDVAALCQRVIHEALATGHLQYCEYQLEEPSGLHNYEARVVISGDDEVLWIVQDVTNRKHVEAELRDSEERLQSFFNATFEAVIIHDYEKILDVNPAAENLLGYTAEEMIGMPVLNLAVSASRETIRQQWRSLTSPNQPYEYEATGQRKDGSTFIAMVSAKAIHYRGRPARVAGIRDITERKKAEEAIRQSEARNRALVNAIPDLMFRIRRDGTYLDCKADHDSDLLMPINDLKGKNVYDVLPADLAAERMRYVELALETGELQHFEYQLRLNSLAERSRELSQLYEQVSEGVGRLSTDMSALRYYEARVVVSGDDEVVTIVRDITERKTSEAALRLSEEKFSKAFQSSPNPMSIATLVDGQMREINDGFTEVMGYTRDEIIGRSAYDLHIWVNPADRELVVQTLLRDGSVRNMECQFFVKSGEMRTGLFSAEIINIGGEQCLIDVIVDITERKRAEQQLWAAAERDRLLSQSALRIRQSLDLQQILTTTVEEVRQFLKTDRVLIGHDDQQGNSKIVAESADPQWRSLMGRIIQDEAHLREIKRMFANGQAWVVDDTTTVDTSQYPTTAFYYRDFQIRASIAVPIVIHDNFFGLLVVHQCSGPRQWQPYEVELLSQLSTQVSIAIQQAQLYQTVRDLNTGLEQQVQERTAQLQQKMEELQELNNLKDEFLNAFSHDLRTPVMGISLVINNMLNQPGDVIPVPRAILDRMVQSSNHQLQLIKSMLEAHAAETRGITLQYELVQLSLLVQVIVEDLEPIVEKNRATLINQVPPDLPLVNADPVQLRRVFENLITNALHHNPPGVCITLDATVEEDLIRFTIRDDGVGMTEATREGLFNRYARGPKSRHSTGIGLGLYLCRQIITAHGGQIGVTSTLNQGSTFWLTLPLAIPAGANPALTEG